MRTLNKLASIILAALLFLLTFTNVQPVSSMFIESPTSQTDSQPYVPDVILLEVQGSASMGLLAGTDSTALNAVLKNLGTRSIKPLFPFEQAASQGVNNLDTTKKLYRVQLGSGTDVMSTIKTLAALPEVVFAEPDYIAYPSSAQLLTIDDPLYAQQWGMTKVNIEGAWNSTYGSPTVAIAVIDSGIDLTHVDLAGNLWTNPGEIAGNGLDDDSNGFIDDVDGWNFVASSNDLWDDNGHGTLVAGAAAAIGGNGQGVVGVCPQCKIMPVKVMQASGAANYSDIAAGILYAAQKGAKVINLSLGGYANSNTLKNAIDTAVNTYGVVVVAGAGNDNLSTAFYPAAYDNVLSAAGTAEDDTKMGFSNYATWVDVSAPAVNVRTTALGGDWANGSGTSIASPFAAGLAGLLRTVHPDWGQATIRSQIVHTTDSIDSANPTFVGMLGTGRLNAGTAMQAPHPLVSMNSYTVNGLASGRPVLGATAQLNITLNNDWWDALGVTGTLSTTDPLVTMINASASYGDVLAATSKTNATAFTFSVDSGAGYNHPIPFKLDITDTTGYTNSFNFTINTETGVVNKSGTLTTDTWTNDKTYLIINNISIPTGHTLTIQPGTVVKFNGNYTLSVRGTLIADGTVDQPITFQSNTAGTWDKIFFDDLGIDAVADVDGNYISGNILRYVNIEGNTGGVTCTTATPYLAHVNLKNGGITCTLGATPIWFLDNTITGSATFTGAGNAYRNTMSGGLTITGAGIVEDNTFGGALSLGSGNARRNTVKNGGLIVGGTLGSIEYNTVTGGNISASDSFSVLTNTVTGSLTAGNSATVDHNTAGNGITVGMSSTVTWNNVENAAGTGLVVGTGVTAQYNRLIGNGTGMTATTGLIEHNLIANNTGVGLQVGAATVRYNTFTGNKGNTILVQGGTPVTIEYNNLEGNTGLYDLYLNIASGVFVTAQHNWWGTTDNLLIAERVYDWNDDDTKATAAYTLKATGPDQTAPGYVRSVAVLPDTTLGIQTGTFEAQFSKPMDTNNSPSMAFYNNIKGTWSHYTSSNSGLPISPDVTAIAIEPNGTKWFGTYSGGVASFDGITWTVYNGQGPYTGWGAYVNTIAIESNNTKWFGMWGGDAASFDGTNWTRYFPNGSELPIGANNVKTIAIEANGIKWFGTNMGVASFDGTTWTNYTSSNSGLPNDNVVAIAIEANGTKWFGTNMGIASFDGTTWKVYNTSNSGLEHDNIYSIAIEANGTKWFGTGNGVASLDGTNWTVYTNTNSVLPYITPIRAIAIEANGTKWLGTNIGVASFDGTTWKVYNTSNSGLPQNIISAIAIEANGTKWFGTNASTGGEVGVLHSSYDHSIIDNQQWPSSSLYRAGYDITSAIAKGTYRVDVKDVFDPDGMRVAPFSNTTFNVDYAGFISDITPPVQPTVTASGNGALTSLSANWSSTDAESPITQYRYGIGSTPGARDVVAWTYVPSTNTSMTRTGLNLTSGQPYYVTVGARNEGGLWSDSGISNGVTDGASLPLSFNKTTPASGAVSQPAGLTLTWAASAGAASYEYCYDTTNDNACSTWVDNGTATSKALSGLSASTTYYWHVRANNVSGTTYSNGLPTDFWSFTTAAFVPGTVPGTFNKSAPLNTATAISTSPTLTWTASSGATSYEYCYDTTNDNICSTWVDNGTSTGKVLSGLSPSTTYYWHVRADNVTGTTYSNGLPTAFWSFTTSAILSGGGSTTGVFRPGNGLLYLKNQNTTGFADVSINYGTGGDYPVAGDWNGDGTATIGIYRNGSFYLRNSNTLGFADIVFAFGTPGDQPVAGDWDGDGVDTIGVYSNGQFLLRNSNSAGTADMSFYLGNPGDVGIAGDWNGDGMDTTGVFRPSNGIIFLKNANTTGFADVALNYGLSGDMPVTGDWNNDGIDTIGVYRNAQFLLRNSNTLGFAEIVFGLGNPGDMPISGNWDGIP